MKQQCVDLLAALRKGSMTTNQIRNQLGIGMPAPRVFELKEMGHNIVTRMVTVKCRFGRTTKVAEYTLMQGAAVEMKRAA